MLASPVVMTGTSSADQPTGCDFAPCSGPLAGSTFAGGDGNLLAPTGDSAYPCSGTSGTPTGGLPPCNGLGTNGSTDWQNVGDVNMATDIPPAPLPGGGPDNGFTGGTAEDNTTVQITTGPSVISAGNDLTRMYEASQRVGGSNFLYLAWQRATTNGAASVDFELNQVPTPALTQSFTGTLTLNRTPNDLLIAYDFSGSGVPTISVMTWLTPANATPTSSCVKNGSTIAAGCWGNEVTNGPCGTRTLRCLGANVIASVNTLGAVYDPFRPISPAGNETGSTPCSNSDTVCQFNENPLPALRFGEMAINLTGAGLFPQGNCATFGSVMAKGRASPSLTSQLKDLIAPVPMYTSNCLQVAVGYQDNAGGAPPNRPPGTGPCPPPCTMSPWEQTGSPGEVGGGVALFFGCNGIHSNCPTDATLPAPSWVYDGGALLFTNTSAAAGVNGGAGETLPVSNVGVTICTLAATRADTCLNRNRNRVAGSPIDCFFQPAEAGTFNIPPSNGTPGSNQLIITQTGVAIRAPWGGAGNVL
jgi:hypothetical protein